MQQTETQESSPRWADALTDPATFQEEQARLGRMWTLLGLVTDVPHDNDWLRTTVGGRSVFLQRFGDSLKAFENVCPHRFAPLRTEDRGNGVIRCGFHHWQYDQDGVAVGIPKCKEMFGVTPREMGVRLTPLEVATCGSLIFGRFVGEEGGDTLEEWLGEAYPIVETLCSSRGVRRQADTPIAANWKLLYHISLDDYHIVAVHPDTFGKHGYLPADGPRYYRLGSHSAYFIGDDAGDVQGLADACRRGEYRPAGYRIFQIFPTLLVVQVQTGPMWHVILQQLVPLAPDRTLSRVWFLPAHGALPEAGAARRLFHRLAAPFVGLALPLYMRKIFREDNSMCERIQEVSGQIGAYPILGRHERRIDWFEEEYAAAMRSATEGD